MEKSTLETLITSLREEVATLKSEQRRNSIAPGMKADCDASFEALPTLADELLTADPSAATQVCSSARE